MENKTLNMKPESLDIDFKAMSFRDWTKYLLNNKTHFDHINWKRGWRLTVNEIHIITSSIQQFQRGENSEGKSLMNYAKELGDKEYVNTMKIFIREEQRHAMVLGNFMQMNGIERIKGHWIDEVFRSLRKLSSLENSITVLLTAEIIAAIYYDALKKSTSSQLLRDICTQILIVEEMHINFQSFTLKKSYDQKTSSGKWLTRQWRKFLMAGTIVVVWFSHIRVLKGGAYSFSEFWRKNFTELKRSLDMVEGHRKIECGSKKTVCTLLDNT